MGMNFFVLKFLNFFDWLAGLGGFQSLYPGVDYADSFYPVLPVLVVAFSF